VLPVDQTTRNAIAEVRLILDRKLQATHKSRKGPISGSKSGNGSEGIRRVGLNKMRRAFDLECLLSRDGVIVVLIGNLTAIKVKFWLLPRTATKYSISNKPHKILFYHDVRKEAAFNSASAAGSKRSDKCRWGC
jgi:hypothetical protein